MHQQIKDRAKEIYRTHTKDLILIMAIYTAIEYIISMFGGNIILNTISAFFTSILAASQACFWFRTYNRGIPDYTDMYTMLMDKTHQTTIVTIIVIRFIIDTVIGVVTAVLAFIPVINIFAILVMWLIGILLSIVWYLFVANPYYSAGDCFRGSWKYMNNEVADYVIFSISISLLPALFCVVVGAFITILLPFLGSVITTVMFAVFEVYISLAMAGYVSELIPREWYQGTAVFDK